MSTTRQELAARVLADHDIDFDDYVAAHRSAGESWLTIRNRLCDEFGIDVGRYTLTRWCRDVDRAAS